MNELTYGGLFKIISLSRAEVTQLLRNFNGVRELPGDDDRVSPSTARSLMLLDLLAKLEVLDAPRRACAASHIFLIAGEERGKRLVRIADRDWLAIPGRYAQLSTNRRSTAGPERCAERIIYDIDDICILRGFEFLV